MDSGAAAWWQWWRGIRAREVIQALLVTALTLIGSYGEAHPRQVSDKIVSGHPVPYTPSSAFLLVAVAGLALIWRRRHPVPVLCVSIAAVLAYSLLGYVNGAALLSPAVALYAVTSTVSVRRAVSWATVTLVALLAGTAIRNPFGTFGGGFDFIPAMVAAALFGGIAVANRRAFAASMQARADDAAQRRIDEERLRIARELHDVVAHTMATINVQAGAAIHVAAERPEVATEALQAIRGASKDGLRELRAILNVLRQADEPDARLPAPGLAQMDALIASTSRAGLKTTLSVTGTRRPVPPAVDLAAYRIVQESLTNAIRHAGPATATVSLGYTAGQLAIEVTDTGLGAPPAGTASGGGHGLTGMRERAASVGGTLQTGPAPGGGFRVAAQLPLGGHTSGPAAPGQADPEQADPEQADPEQADPEQADPERVGPAPVTEGTNHA